MINEDMSTQAIELSFTVLEDIIMLRPLTNKKDIMELASNALKKVQEGKNYPQVLKLAYKEMITKLEGLSFEEIKEIRQIIEE
jgi:hypothetical protein